MENCNCHNEIILKGSGQLERYLEALDPSYVSIDGRSFDDMLVFASAYAEQIRFYDMPGSQVSDPTPPAKVSWVEFFKRDMAVIAASIATIDLDKIKNNYEATIEQALLNPTVDLYTSLLNQIVAIAVQIDQWYTIAIDGNPLRTDINLAINSTLSGQLKTSIAYEEGFIVVDSKTVLNIDYSKITNKQEWGINDAVNPEFDIYTGTTPEARILSAVPYVEDIFQSFFTVISNIVDASPSYLTYALTQYPSHQPYMALYIAFIKLFGLVQQQMNGLTGRMLDFYYEDVLRLAHKPAVPDKVYVVFQLAQNVAQYDLPQGTAMSAGKDASGKDQVYKTDSDFVINQANVKALKNIFIDKTANSGATIAALYANPVANSMDGNGAKFTTPDAKWPTFGSGPAATTDPNNICEYISQQQALLTPLNNADIGFAIASPQLVLQEGNRLICLNIPDLAKHFLSPTPQKNIQIALTGEKGWLVIKNQVAVTKGTPATTVANTDWVDSVNTNGVFDPTYQVAGTGIIFSDESLYIYLPVAEQGIVAYSTKLHGDQVFNTAYPVMQVLISPDVELSASAYNSLNTSSLSLSVKVGSININPPAPEGNQGAQGAQGAQGNQGNQGATPTPVTRYFDGLKTLVLQSDTGLITPGKPFDPFTNIPFPGSSFYIGSDEVFNKSLGNLSVNISKTQDVVQTLQSQDNAAGSTTPDQQYMVSVRENNSWITLTNTSGLPDTYASTQFTDDSLAFDILYDLTNSRYYGGFYNYGYLQEAFFESEIRADFSYSGPEERLSNYTQQTPVKLSLDRRPIEYNPKYDLTADKGFLRIDNIYQAASMNDGTKSDSSIYDTVPDRLNNAPQFQIKELSVSYVSTLAQLDPQIDQLFHIYPFGSVETLLPQVAGDTVNPQSMLEANPLMIDAKGILLPQFTFLSPTSVYDDFAPDVESKTPPVVFTRSPQYSGDNTLDRAIYDASGLAGKTAGGNNQYSYTIQEEGLLFIGVEKLQPLQTLSLLFEFAPGSAIDEDTPPPTINWSYLIYNEWRPMNAENIDSDSTYGFQTTGIVKLDVPADANDSHTIITDGLYWFCASVTANSDCIPQLINVVAQATEAVFYDQGNSQSHYDNALPAGSISKLSVAVAQVTSVQQPYASFDGKHKEVGKEYYTRVSERLRHKGRAITAWDYEHLVLNQFPEVFKVKCITNTDPQCLCPKPVASVVQANAGISKTTCCGPIRAWGNVLIVPVPNLKNDNAANPLQPKTSQLTLIEIVNYLSPLTSPFVTVHAKNPVYEQVIVFFRVKFLNGIDKGYYLKKLNNDIVQYLTPWAFDQDIEADFGQKIYASAIINFIQQTGYVDFITDFLMGVCRDECCVPAKTDPPAITGDGFITALNEVSGCNDIESFLTDQGYFVGDVIAEPSTQMSLLVSAPKHIILLYEDPVVQTACEKRLAVAYRPVPVRPAPIVVEEPTANQLTPEPEPAVMEPAANETASATEEEKPAAAPEVAPAPEIAPVAAIAEEAEKPNVIEEAIENFDKTLMEQASKIAEKGKAAVKKAEDFFKNVVKGKSADQVQGIDPAPEVKQLPPAGNKPADDNNKS